MGVGELLKTEFPPRRAIMTPWLPERGLAMVYAPRGIGKTFFALEVALAVATGTEFLGWTVEHPLKVLYLDGEMSLSEIQTRVRGSLRDRVLAEKDQIRFVTAEMQAGPILDLSQPGWHRHLVPYVDGVDLIIVDNISTLCRTGNENDADSWNVTQEWAVHQKSEGRSVLFIHHAGKGGQQRGTSKREDVMDTVIALKRPEGYKASEGARFEVHFEKSRGFSGRDAEPFIAQLHKECEVYSWTHENLAQNQYDRAVAMLADGMSQVDIAIELGVNKSTVSRWAKRGKVEGNV